MGFNRRGMGSTGFNRLREYMGFSRLGSIWGLFNAKRCAEPEMDR